MGSHGTMTVGALIWATVAATSLSSGQLLHRRGWHAVVATALPLLGLAGAAVLARPRRGPPGRARRLWA
jgi:hypothetical protein